MATDTFDISVSSVTQNAGTKALGPYRARCKITTVTTVEITRGNTTKPQTTSSENLSAARKSYAVSGGMWRPTWEDAVGTVITERAGRVNEAGFWEKVTTIEVRTASISAWDDETGEPLTEITS
ncbi:MAG: hypothetical protein IJR99_12330 [Kiritimatiellae bacterium]|nr:hypothetical protein [Kiritimatiellia bacterium]